jgi:hypothetical protein
LLDLASLLGQDYAKSFWNGQGTLAISSEEVRTSLTKDPNLTLGALREQLRATGKPLFVQTGLNVKVDAADPLRLGSRNGGGRTTSVAFSAHADAGARLFVILGPEAFASLQNEHPADLGTLLHDYTILSGQDALIVMAAGGEAGTEFSSTVLNHPGMNVGISFKAGAAVEWMICRAAHDGDSFFDALRATLAEARLPQSDPGEPVVNRPSTVDSRLLLLDRNEVLYSSFTGFLSIAGKGTFGYDASGTTNYAIGKLDLATKLVVKAEAEVSVGFRLAGAFRTLVLPGTPGSVRIVVEKHRTSTFDFGVGVTVDAKLTTKGLPDTRKASMALVESILGFRTPQIARQFIDLAALPPEALKQHADGAIKACVEEWVGKGFDTLAASELGVAIKEITAVAHQITHAEDRLIALYEQYVVANLDPAFNELETIIGKGSVQEQRGALLQKAGDADLRYLVGLLVDRDFGQVIVAYERVVSDLRQQLTTLRQFIDSDVKQEIRKFIQGRLKRLGLEPLFNELKQIDSVDKLKQRTTAAVDGLVERLTGQALDKLFASQTVDALIKEANAVAKTFDDVLRRINDTVTRALNAQGRFELSYAYQRVREGDKLMDVQVRVEHADPLLRARAHEIYRHATRGRFDEVLKDENAALISVGAAAFTDSLKRVGTLKLNVFGWNYKEVNTVLASLDATVKESPLGLVTVYNVGAKGESIRESRKRTVALNYVFQVTGQVKGAFEADNTLRRQTVDAFETLNRVQSELDYKISDPLTSLDELGSYLSIGTRLHVLGPGQTARLIGSIQELRRPANGAPAALDEHGFRSVGVKYTVGFAGEALARALTADLTGTTITWWDDRPAGKRQPIQINAKNHQQALQSIYVDRLIASYVVGRSATQNEYALPALYAAGILRDFLDNPNIAQTQPWQKRVVTSPDGTPITVPISPQSFGWANRHYFVNVALAKFLDGFRVSLARSSQQPIGVLQTFLTGLVEDLLHAGERDEASFPFMLLDELVRLANPASPDARRALLEITLLDDQGQPANYIPVVA